jgi:hypothetical protein
MCEHITLCIFAKYAEWNNASLPNTQSEIVLGHQLCETVHHQRHEIT